MIRLIVLMVLLILGVGFCLFQFKYRVVSLASDLKVMEEIIFEKKQNIRLLEAEWEHITTPGRIETLCQKHLVVEPLKAASYIHISQIPFRDDDHVLDMVQSSLAPFELKSLSRKTHSMKVPSQKEPRILSSSMMGER